MNIYYLDNASTTPPADSVLDAVTPYIEKYWYNPSSLYLNGANVKKAIEDVRRSVANCINANSGEIYYTSGSCESNNWVIRGFDDANYYTDSVIITTPIEHKSIIDAVVYNSVLQSDVEFCKVDSYGFVDLESLHNLLQRSKGKKILVSVIMANNEIGTINNITRIAEIVHNYGGILHTDATQALPAIPIDVKKMGIDLLSASAQKLHGLKGTGFLYKKKGINIKPLIYGAQEHGNRGGTENVVGIIALGEAIKNLDYNNDDLIAKRNYMIDRLIEAFGCKLNGSRESRLPNNINVTFPQNITAEALIYMLDLDGIMVSAASACNSHEIVGSHVLDAIGLDEEEQARTLRITLPEDIKFEEIDNVVRLIKKEVNVLTI